jgi:predicted small lipoprotein YifL
VRRRAAGLLAATALAAWAAGCGVKGPPRPSGAPERPAPRDAAPAGSPAPPVAEGAR